MIRPTTSLPALVLAFVLWMSTSLIAGCAGGSWPALPSTPPLPQVTPPKLVAPGHPTPSPAPSPQPTRQTPPFQLSEWVGGPILIARDAAQMEQWEEVQEELEEALELSIDPQERALLADLLAQLQDQQYAQVRRRLEELSLWVTAESPLLSELDNALQFAYMEDWEDTREEVEEAMALTQDRYLLHALEEVLADLDRRQYDEVIQDLTRLVEGVGDEDPALPTLRDAKEAARRGEWERVQTLLRKAAEQTQDPQHQAFILEMLDDLEKGNTAEVVSDLSVLLGTHGHVDPVLAEVRAALAYALRQDWENTMRSLQDAEEHAVDPADRERLATLQSDLEAGRYDAVLQALEAWIYRGSD